MEVVVEIPDTIVAAVSAHRDLSRELLEAFALEEYRAERLSRGQLSELLGLSFWETEEFLARRKAQLHFDLSDFEQGQAALARIRQ
jgi:predicted HTH domain antitoxin